MARVTANEYDITDTYVNAVASTTSYRLATTIIVGGASDYHRGLIRMNRITSNKKAISIKLHVYFSVLFGSGTTGNLYAYRAADKWNSNVTYETCPEWLMGESVGALPAAAGYGVYDLTGFISLDDLLNTGIVLKAVLTSGSATATPSFLSSKNHENAPYFEIIYADSPDLPTDLAPAYGANVVVTGSNGHFSWVHNPSPISGLPQKGYNLQLSADGVTWTTVSATTANQYADVATTSIPSGNFYWRVQTIDADDVPSDYSAQQYAYYGTAPAAPTIITSVFNSSKPRIEWSTAYAQAGYRVQILLGEVSVIDAAVETADAFYDVPVALADDTQYTVRVTVKDESAHYSAWAEDAISTNYAVPEVPTFILTKKKDSVELNITNPTGEAVIRNDIYRLEGTEHIRIGSTTGTTYTDWSVGTGIQTYKVAAVGASGEAMSTAAEVDFAVVGTYLTAVDDTEHPFKVKYNVLDKNSAEHNMTLVEYAGREKPVAEFGEVIQRSVYVSFDSDDAGEYARLHDILSSQSVVLFRNAREKIYGVCTNLTEQPQDYHKTAYNLSFVISEIEHSEVV